MKLRIEDNSLRLRLSEEDVAQFAREGRVAVVLPLAPGPAGQLAYALQLTADDSTAAAQALRVAYTPGALAVLVPATLAQAWLQPEQISLSGTVDVAEGPPLRILVEKDLGCRH